MSKLYDSLMRAQRLNVGGPDGSLRDRLLRFLPGGQESAPPDLASEAPAAPIPSGGRSSRQLEERLASLQVAVAALDDRLSAEVVEREAKLLEELRRGMRGLETELSDRFAAAALEMKRTTRRGVALVVAFVALLAGFVVGALALI